jgi:hypothetical protein
MQLFVKTWSGKTITLDCEPDESIDSFHHKFAAVELMSIFDVKVTVRFIFCGKQLQSGKLSDYDIERESTIHCAGRLVSNLYVERSPEEYLQLTDISRETTFGHLKQQIENLLNIPIAFQRLSIDNEELPDDLGVYSWWPENRLNTLMDVKDTRAS